MVRMKTGLARLTAWSALLLLTACGGGNQTSLSGSGSELLSRQAVQVPAGSSLAMMRKQSVPQGLRQEADVATVDPTAFFNWAERQFPHLFPGPQGNLSVTGIVFRYYPATDLYLGISAGRVIALGPVATAGQVVDLGPLTDFAPYVNTGLSVASVRISAGADYSLALRADGTVLAWGEMYGGPGVALPGSAATVVSGLSRIKAVYASSFLSAAIDADGSVWAWGYERFGLLSGANRSGFVVPVPAVIPSLGRVVDLSFCELRAYALRADGRVLLVPGISTSTSLQAKEVPGLEGVVGFGDLSGLRQGSLCQHLAIKGDGTVWRLVDEGSVFNQGATHYNVSIRQVTGLPAIKQASCFGTTGSDSHCIALATNGTIWTWGNNSFGQLGVGDKVGRTIPVRVSGLPSIAKVGSSSGTSYAVTIAGGVFAWGLEIPDRLDTNPTRPTRVFADANKVVDLSVGFGHAMFLVQDGSVYAWGENDDGELGDGTLSHRSFLPEFGGPVKVLGVTLN